MLIRYLEEYLELVNYMNYTAAARKLNLTSSALSKHIAALEREFDTVLVDRSKQQIELTPQGRVFCEEASKMIEAYHEARRRVHEASLEIRVAGSLRDSAVRRLLSTAQDAQRDADDRPRVVSREYPANLLREALMDGKVDLVVDVIRADVANEPAGCEDPDIACRPLTSVPLLAVVTQSNPLAKRTSVTLDDLASERIMHPTGSMSVQYGASAIEAVFAAHGITMRKRIFFANTWNDFPTADFEGSVFVMPRSLFNRQLFGATFDAYRGVPITDDDARFPYWLSWRRAESDPRVLRYIEVLRTIAEQ